MENILIAENIRSYIPETGPISLSVSHGEHLYIQGRDQECNVLFEMLTGLKQPEEGTVTLLNQNVYAVPEWERAALRRNHIGAIPRKSGFVPEWILLEQVQLPMILAGLSTEDIRQRIRKNTFDYLPLHNLCNPAMRCSQRTLALAGLLRALVMEPKVLILNAAFDHLNQKDSMLVWQAVQAILLDNMAFIYLSSAPASGNIPWTQIMQISGR